MKGLTGVLGGMEPTVTVDLFNRFVTFTVVQRDQEHIPLIISSIPNIPDRTDALMHHGHSPFPAMRDYIHRLEDAGTGCITVSCNTAHFWFNELRKCCHTGLLGIVETTMNEVKSYGKSRIGLLTTNTTPHMGFYQKGIESLGLTCISPDSSGQEKVMESIYCSKADDLKWVQTLMDEQVEVLFSCGAQIIVLGCTEVPVIFANAVRESPNKYIDSTGPLVRASIKWYEKRVGKHHLLMRQQPSPD